MTPLEEGLRKRILWFDPGGTTGWVYYKGTLTPEMLRQGPYTDHYVAGDFPEYNLFEVWPIIEQFKPDIVGYETWRLWSSKSDTRKWSDFPEIQIIGAIRLATMRILGHDGLKQNPGERAWATDDKLRDRGLYWPIIHRRDATKHLLCYQRFDLNIPL